MDTFSIVLWSMAVLGVVVFVSLFFVDAGYGKLISSKWGPAIPNRVGWMLMECPVFFVVAWLWLTSEVRWQIPYVIFLIFFEIHYFQRSFIFPMLLRGRSKMPLSIILMSITFNLINGYIQGWWLFRVAPGRDFYAQDWLMAPQFLAGTLLFFSGMFINMQSDSIIRNLRKPGDTRHYLPKGGFYNYVTSANYFGEIVEWLGWALLTWSWAGAVFFWFTFANLVPRANSIYHKYQDEFEDEFDSHKLKRVFPRIY